MIIVEFVKVLRGTLGNSPKNSPNLCGEFEKKTRHVGKDVPRDIHLPVQGGNAQSTETFSRLKEYVDLLRNYKHKNNLINKITQELPAQIEARAFPLGSLYKKMV